MARANRKKAGDDKVSEATIAQKALEADFANIIRKVKEKKPLTASERAMLAARTDSAEEPVGVHRAKNKADLAKAMGMSRQRLNGLSKREGFPEPAQDGSFSIAEVVAFLKEDGIDVDAERGLKGLKEELVKEQIKKIRFSNEVEQKKYIFAEEVREDVNRMATKLKTVLYARMESDLPPILEGMSAPDIQVELRKACNEVLQQISTEPWD